MVAIHTRTYRESSRGNRLTLLKLALIVVFGTAWVAGSEYSQQLPLSSLMEASEIATGAGAVALIYVTMRIRAGTPLLTFWVS